MVKPGADFRDVIRHRHDTGSFHGDVEAYCDDILSHVGRTQSSIVETADGRLIEIKNQPGAAGGWLATHDDVTARIRADERIAHMAHYDALTDLPNRVLLRGHLSGASPSSARQAVRHPLYRRRRVQGRQRLAGT